MEKNHIKISFSEFINENYNDKFNISHFFRKIKDEFGDEYTDDNWISIKKDLLKDLRKSLELIGNGEIIEKDYYDYPGDRLMYKEYFKDNTRILVVQAAFDKQPYGSTKEFEYEIGVYKNNPTTSQIGGGYGTSGMTTIKHTQLLGSSENYCRNKRVISKLCKFIKKYVEENL